MTIRVSPHCTASFWRWKDPPTPELALVRLIVTSFTKELFCGPGGVDYAPVMRSACLRSLTLTWVVASAFFALAGCGGTSESGTERSGGVPNGRADNQVDAGLPPDPDATVNKPPRVPPPQIASPRGTQRPPDEPTPFEDPGCPAVPAPVEDRQCDPLALDSGCEIGFGCFPYVDYPTDPCAPEIFGTRCRAQGTGTQGQECAMGGCAEGYLCVATGQGTQCARLCKFPGQGQCDPGLVCGSVDIQGFGVCF